MSSSIKNNARYSRIVSGIVEREQSLLPSIEYRDNGCMERLIRHSIFMFVGQLVQNGWSQKSLVDWYLSRANFSETDPNSIFGNEFFLNF